MSPPLSHIRRDACANSARTCPGLGGLRGLLDQGDDVRSLQPLLADRAQDRELVAEGGVDRGHWFGCATTDAFIVAEALRQGVSIILAGGVDEFDPLSDRDPRVEIPGI